MILACATVKCIFTVDDKVFFVTYNNHKLAITGNANSFKEKKEISFESCSEESPGILSIEGWDDSSKDHCIYGGLLLHCTVDKGHQYSNPWHNFVSDATNWSDGVRNSTFHGRTICQTDSINSFHYQYRNIPFIKDLIQKGAKKIWLAGTGFWSKHATLNGSPPVKKGLVKLII